MSFYILGTGKSLPKKIVTNDDLAEMVDTSNEWIYKRVGIKERHICTTETAVDLAYEASLDAINNSGIKKEEIDMILVASVSSDYTCPSVSCMLQKKLDIPCFAMDINAACAGFVFLLETAAAFIAKGSAKKILVVGAEKLSRIMDWEDRSTCIIFGDGAGAAVLDSGKGYLDSLFTVTGDDSVIRIPRFKGKSPFEVTEDESPYIFMNGQETFKYAVHSVSRDVKDLLDRNNLTIHDIKYIIPHQANRRIIETVSSRLSIPMEKFVMNIESYGNTSSASIPIALDELQRSGKLQRGDLLILSAFGGGLASAAALINW